MSRTLTLQVDDDLYQLLTTAARSQDRSIGSFIDSALRARIRELPFVGTHVRPESGVGAPPRYQNERRRTLERLFELFEGHDAEAEIRRLKEQDEGF